MSGFGAPVCAGFAATPETTLALNSDCECWAVDADSVRAALAPGARAVLSEDHQHLFAATGVFLHPADLAAMCSQVDAIESVQRLPGYIAATAAPAIQAGTRGMLMGYDFHLTKAGPRLIEINTNAGGAFLVQAMYDALRLPTLTGLPAPEQLRRMVLREWVLAGRAGVPQTIAIVDDDPLAQYLYGDMLAAVELLQQHFARVVVLPAAALTWSGSVLSADSLDGAGIDLIYNRHTDFALSNPSVHALRDAWLADRVVVSPSPRHHALFASKQNLPLLGDLAQLARWGATPDDLELLRAVVPAVTVTPANAADLWEQRRNWFFKPVAGFGGRAAYRGAKMTKRVWARVLSGADGDYIAQKFVPSPVRRLPGTQERQLKYDVRLYTYAGEPLGLVARLYHGQTTNFRTPDGGFAPVALVSDQEAADIA